MLSRAWRTAKISLNGPPRAYRAGSLLQHLRTDFADFDFELVAANRALLRTADLVLQAQEIVEPHFLMHVVSTEICCEFTTAMPLPSIAISARHRGAWRRTGVTFAVVDGAADSLLSRLIECEPLQTSLVELDFTEWRLQSCDPGWHLTIRLFGASEVVGQAPAFRRYVRLERSQRDALLMAMRTVRALLG